MELLEYLVELEDRVQMLLPLVSDRLDHYWSLEQVNELLTSNRLTNLDEPQPEEV
ncbi:hypothetical protein NDA01_07495 [Trichocoleus desertorum AS-A10]|uniref:hypothetical protein n=1 Tax=Trichocoleus desertorum TaxID=1481672 RepID=UPI003297D065